MKNVFTTMAMALLVSVSISGTAYAGVLGSDDTSSSVTKDTARTLNKVVKGTIIQVSEAKIEEANGTKATGATAGIATGVAIGNANGHGGLLGALIGGVIGGVGGAIAAAAAGSQTAQDLIIQTDTGDMINITQAVDEKIGPFADGDAVLVVYKGEKARVLRNKIGAAQAAQPVAAAPAAPVAQVAAPVPAPLSVEAGTPQQ